MSLTAPQANALAIKLDVELNAVCHMCLSVVSFALEEGTPDEIAGALRRMTPELWADGLGERVLASVARLCAAGVPHALEALAELEARGGRSVVARAIVRRLAVELSARMRRAGEAAMN